MGLSYNFCRSSPFGLQGLVCKLDLCTVCGSKTTRREGEVTAWCVGLVTIFVNHIHPWSASYM